VIDRAAVGTAADAHAVNIAGGCTIVRADEGSPRGWRAPYYYCREPALSMVISASAQTLTFWSMFGPLQCRAETDDSKVAIANDRWKALVQLSTAGEQPQIDSVTVSGALRDTLEIS